MKGLKTEARKKEQMEWNVRRTIEEYRETEEGRRKEKI